MPVMSEIGNVPHINHENDDSKKDEEEEGIENNTTYA